MRLIDADELKTPVGSYNPVKFTWEYGDVISLEDIDHAPTVDPIKHGRWRPHFTEPYENEGEVYWWVCSECEEVENRKSDYCPNCGAKMDEVE